MSRFGSQYQVSRSTGVCAATGQPLSPGSVCIATLCERVDDDGFDRSDYSLEAWESGARPERLFSFWRTTVAEPGGKRKILVDDEVLLDLFHRLGDDEERSQRVAFRFVLALILMRKRLLRFAGRKGSADGPAERWMMRPKGVGSDEPPIEVVNPNLSDEDVRELTAQLTEILRGEL